MAKVKAELREFLLGMIQGVCEEEDIPFSDALAVLLAAQSRWVTFDSKLRSPARDSSYLAFVRTKACCACGNGNTVAHHDGPRGTGEKTDDYRTVPLCVMCHGKVHQGLLEMDFGPVKEDLLVEFLRRVRGV